MERSPFETIIEAMTEFGKVEPKKCIIIWIDEGGDICWSSTTDQMTLQMGMVELLRTILKKEAEE